MVEGEDPAGEEEEEDPVEEEEEEDPAEEEEVDWMRSYCLGSGNSLKMVENANLIWLTLYTLIKYFWTFVSYHCNHDPTKVFFSFHCG